MDPNATGSQYDRIASWYHEGLQNSVQGLEHLRRALRLLPRPGEALDVGCGAGGRMIRALREAGHRVTGIDVSAGMLEIARREHPDCRFLQGDISAWEPAERYDLILAWDSTFHLPYASQERVLRKLCGALAPGGLFLFTAGSCEGERKGAMQGLDFHYSSLGDRKNLELLRACGCRCLLLDHDQHPEEHVVFLALRERLSEP